MQHSNTIFHQIIRAVPRHLFDAVAERYKGDHRVRSLSCWTQFCVMAYGQLCSRHSLRDVISAWDSHASAHYHVGARKVKRSTLADANAKRPAAMYMEVFYWLLGQSRCTGIGQKDVVRLIDSTTIDLCKQEFGWASFRSGKSGVKIHTVYDPAAQTPTFFSITNARKHDKKEAEKMPLLKGATYVFDRAYNDYAWFHNLTLDGITFVSRMKSNAGFEVTESFPVSDTGVLEDQWIRLSSAKGRQACPTTLRRIRFVREADNKALTFITNDLKRSAGEIASLYKQRWQIELFFKWIKQNLRIKAFYGTSENAVKTQIWIAITVYVLVAIVKKRLQTNISLHAMLQVISLSVFEKVPLNELLTNQHCLFVEDGYRNPLLPFDL